MKHPIISLMFMLLPSLVLASAEVQSIGQDKAQLCAGCHGQDGIGLSDEYPNLAGQKQAYLVKQLKAFKSKTRLDPTMNVMAATLSEHDMQQLAHYFANVGQQPAAEVTVSPLSDQPSADEFSQPTYVTMKKSGTVTAYPSNRVWQAGPNMLYDAVTPDGQRLVATSPSTNQAYIFNAKTGQQLAIVSVGKAPKGVKITPNGQLAYVSNEGSNNISVIRLSDYRVIDTIKVEKAPHNVRFTKSGKIAYVTLQGGAGIGVIDTASRQQIKVIPVPGITGPHNLDLSGNERIAYVRDFVHHVAVVDLQTEQVLNVIKVGSGHGGIDVAPNDEFVATAAIGDDHISLISTKDYSVLNIKVGQGPHGIRASADSRWLYVTVTGTNQLVVIDIETKQVVKRIATESFPFWIAVPNNP